jgi:hypothetical protein
VAEIGAETGKPGATRVYCANQIDHRTSRFPQQNSFQMRFACSIRVLSGSTDGISQWFEIGAGNSQTWGHESIGTVRLTIGRAVASNGKIHFQWDFALL